MRSSATNAAGPPNACWLACSRSMLPPPAEARGYAAGRVGAEAHERAEHAARQPPPLRALPSLRRPRRAARATAGPDGMVGICETKARQAARLA
jgi:hypothetical protein